MIQRICQKSLMYRLHHNIKMGKIEARKEVSNHEPKLGEEIEYRIIFNNTVKDGKTSRGKNRR